MSTANSSQTTKELAMRFVLENIDYRKRCLYLQEIISMGRKNKIWRQALTVFFDSAPNKLSVKAFSQN